MAPPALQGVWPHLDLATILGLRAGLSRVRHRGVDPWLEPYSPPDRGCLPPPVCVSKRAADQLSHDDRLLGRSASATLSHTAHPIIVQLDLWWPNWGMWRAVFLWLLLVSAAAAQDARPARDVSLIALISQPSIHNGQRVRVVGYLNFEFEGDQIYLGKADFDAANYSNSLWVEKPKWLNDDASRRFSRRYARLEGTFHAGPTGHLGLFPGSIEEVRRIEVWPSRREFEKRVRMPWWQEYRLPLAATGLLVLAATSAAAWSIRRG